MREYIVHQVYTIYENNDNTYIISILNTWITNTINRIYINA